MNRTTPLLVVIIVLLACPVYALYSVADKGMWPKSWPEQLESFRSRSQTFVGPTLASRHYAIAFSKRDEFESAWPHILKVKSQGAPIVLRRGPSFWLGEKPLAGVCIHTPPEGVAPVVGDKITSGQWRQTNYIELIVDGEIVDLNRIALPPDTPIIDERFKDGSAQ